MRVGALVLVGLLWGCSLGVSPKDDGECNPEGTASVEGFVERKTRCNATAHSDECASAGLPSAYGVDEACSAPFSRDGDLCHHRPAGLAGCEHLGTYLCCPP